MQTEQEKKAAAEEERATKLPNPAAPEVHEEKPARCQVTFTQVGGVGYQTNTILTEQEVFDEIVTKGGPSRLGYAVIPISNKPGQRSEKVVMHRQSLMSYIVVELGERRVNLVLPSAADIGKVNRENKK